MSGPTNPWHKNRPNNSRSNGSNLKKSIPAPASKFQEAQKKLQEAVQKHIKDYDSSSDEDTEIETDTVIESILKSYGESGGTDALGRTKGYLEDNFAAGAITCLICISKVKRADQIWNCGECYCSMHLMCIQRWSKDTIVQLKQASEAQIQVRQIVLEWCCPKCRHKYKPNEIPESYRCFCGKSTNPVYQPLLAPHSCGETCGKPLKPFCGHNCVLLCHPGPCPPCPKTVSVTCYCGSEKPKLQRCSRKEWSCLKPCKKPLLCGKHFCSSCCHAGECKPCPKKSIQKCMCGSQQTLRDCTSPLWQCDKVCGKPLDCGNHNCQEVCHSGSCGTCILAKQRACPCGKSKYQLPCTQDTPTCGDTCGKTLECGLHVCNQRCHKDNCGSCTETITKSCRCGLHQKEVQCKKPYLCETKCKRMKDCNKHPCNRKCCDSNCPPCEKPCGRTLNCGSHKCPSICHRGPCYPCSLTEMVSCRCGATKITVPCGRKQKTKPPKCLKLCTLPPECHHEKRDPHKCHFSDCPPCRQTCNKIHPKCGHQCPAPCHSSVLVKIQAQKGSMPWENTSEQLEKKALPCPDCVVPVPITCFGKHETSDWPCYTARPSSCHKPCGRFLACQNHTCSLNCHVVEGAPDDVKAGINCQQCESPCTKPRPEGCQHPCPKPCHPGPCPPCKQMLRVKCHCGLTQPYAACKDWIIPENREQLQSCGNQCPNNYECGHRCRANCHSGPCPNADHCKKKVKVTCSCKRIKKEFQCEYVRKNTAVVECDEICSHKREEEKKKNAILEEQRRIEEELKNKKELEKYEKMFAQKKKSRKRTRSEQEDNSFLIKYKYVIAGVTFLILAIVMIYLFN